MDAFQTDGSETVIEKKFEDLVGEGKKFATPDDLAKAKLASDEFIEQLKRENAEMRTSLSKRETEEQFLDRLKQLAQPKSPDAGDNPPQGGTQNGTAVTPETVEEIIERREAQKRTKANLDTALAKVQELFGDDYKRHVARVAQSVGMTTAEMTELASRNPNAFFRILGVDGQTQQIKSDAFAPPRSTVSVNHQTRSDVKNYAYFQKIRAEKGEAAYFTPSVQMEMWNSLKQLGEEEFYKR